mgnify:CR=1 FL=1
MPMDFPDLAALRRSFDLPAALPYKEGETEAEYRERCAVWSEQKWNDHIQAHEIRTGKGWDQWNQTQQTELLKKKLGPETLLNMMLRKPEA